MVARDDSQARRNLEIAIEKGLSLTTIAAKLGVCEHSVYGWLKRGRPIRAIYAEKLARIARYAKPTRGTVIEKTRKNKS